MVLSDMKSKVSLRFKECKAHIRAKFSFVMFLIMSNLVNF